MLVRENDSRDKAQLDQIIGGKYHSHEEEEYGENKESSPSLISPEPDGEANLAGSSSEDE